MSIPNENSGVSAYQSVPTELQRKAVLKIIEVCEDLSWMDNRAFLSLGGANSSMSQWASSLMGIPVNNLMFQLSRMGIAIEKSKEEKPYTQRDYLDDIERYVFAEVLAGKLLSQNKMAIANKYIDQLIATSPILNSIQKTVLAPETNTALFSDVPFISDNLFFYADYGINITCNENDPMQDAGFITSIKFSGETGIEALCYEKLTDARRLFQLAKHLDPDEINRGKYEYLIMIINRVLL